MAEKRMVEKWFTFDGKECNSQAEADAYEAANADLALVGLTRERVLAAMAYEDGARGIAEAIERAAYVIAQQRKKLGFYKRARNGADDEQEPPPPASATGEPAEGEPSPPSSEREAA